MEHKKVAAITGGSRGIGLAFAQALLQRDFQVGLLDVSGHDEAAADLCKQHGHNRAIGVYCDVRREKVLRTAIKTVVDKFGPLTLMCNNAGVATPLFEDVEKAVGINVIGVINGTVIAREFMPEGGVIVNTASVAGLGPVDFSPVYAATKAAVVNFTRSLRWMAEAENIRVCAICPNFTDTAMVRSSLDDPSFSAIVASQPGGLLSVAEVAKALMLILDDARLAADILAVTALKGIRVVRPPPFTKFAEPLTLTAKL